METERQRTAVETKAAVATESAGDSGLRQWRQWQWRRQPTAAIAWAMVAETEAATRADSNQPTSGNNSGGIGGRGGGDGGSCGSGSGDGSHGSGNSELTSAEVAADVGRRSSLMLFA